MLIGDIALISTTPKVYIECKSVLLHHESQLVLDPAVMIISCMQGSGEGICMNHLELANDDMATYMVGREICNVVTIVCHHCVSVVGRET